MPLPFSLKIKYLNTKNLFTIISCFSALFFIASSVQAATLSLSLSYGNYSAGQTFSVNILLDTEGAAALLLKKQFRDSNANTTLSAPELPIPPAMA